MTGMRRIIYPVSISGTRDSFGIGKEFIDPESGKTIDNWSAWEKAGYKPAKSTLKGSAKGAFMRKKDKMKFDSKQRVTV